MIVFSQCWSLLLHCLYFIVENIEKIINIPNPITNNKIINNCLVRDLNAGLDICSCFVIEELVVSLLPISCISLLVFIL
jgi:hypothetical protein